MIHFAAGARSSSEEPGVMQYTLRLVDGNGNALPDGTHVRITPLSTTNPNLVVATTTQGGLASANLLTGAPYALTTTASGLAGPVSILPGADPMLSISPSSVLPWSGGGGGGSGSPHLVSRMAGSTFYFFSLETNSGIFAQNVEFQQNQSIGGLTAAPSGSPRTLQFSVPALPSGCTDTQLEIMIEVSTVAVETSTTGLPSLSMAFVGMSLNNEVYLAQSVIPNPAANTTYPLWISSTFLVPASTESFSFDVEVAAESAVAYTGGGATVFQIYVSVDSIP